VDCISAKKGHCSPRLVALWIAQFVGALCATASGCGHLALGLSCSDAGAIPASWLPNQASGVCWQDPLLLGQA